MITKEIVLKALDKGCVKIAFGPIGEANVVVVEKSDGNFVLGLKKSKQIVYQEDGSSNWEKDFTYEILPKELNHSLKESDIKEVLETAVEREETTKKERNTKRILDFVEEK